MIVVITAMKLIAVSLSDRIFIILLFVTGYCRSLQVPPGSVELSQQWRLYPIGKSL